MTERVTASQAASEDTNLENALRPRHLADDEFIGQATIKRGLRLMITAAKQRGEPVDHVLLAGPPGLGKTTLAHIIAAEMEGRLRVTSGPALERPGDLASTLSSLDAHEVLFIDEIHRLGKTVEEILYPAMEDYALDIVVGGGRPHARTYRLALPRFTVIGATTSAGALTPALRDRFGAVHRLEFYDVQECGQIVRRSAGILEVAITAGGAAAIARRSRGTARVCNRLLRRVRDYAEVMADGTITSEVADAAMNDLEVDEAGLDAMDRRILTTIVDAFDGGPVGLQALSATLAEDVMTLEAYYEPFLLQAGFLARTPRGGRRRSSPTRILGARRRATRRSRARCFDMAVEDPPKSG